MSRATCQEWPGVCAHTAMHRVIGVRFQEASKLYYFSPEGFEHLTSGEYVVVDTSRGPELARVVIPAGNVVTAELTEPLKPIARMAYSEDLDQVAKLKERARHDLGVVRRIARARDLPMKVVNASYNLDGSRLSVFFTSESRVDFRDLLRELGQALGVPVQLRQVGPRDQAKAVDGYGVCGRRLCCSSWLISFPAISIKMAKEQNKPLNPSKISGQCGRLLCCLAYENDTYRQLKSELPRPGTPVSTPSGDARVLAVNALRQTVTLQMTTMEVVELPAAALALDRGVVRLLAPAPPEPAPSPPEPERQSPPASRRREGGREEGGPGTSAGVPPSRPGPAFEPRRRRPSGAGDRGAPPAHPAKPDATEPPPAGEDAGRKRRNRRGSRRRGKPDDSTGGPG